MGIGYKRKLWKQEDDLWYWNEQRAHEGGRK